MRIDRIDIQGFGPLTGSFCFGPDGLGYWGAANRSGKSALTAAVATAFYGDPDGRASRPEGDPGWIVVRLTRDDGEPLVIGRNLGTGVVQVADASGQDVTTRFHNPSDGVEVGESILGMTRTQFLEAGFVRFDDLRATPGNRNLLALLKYGRGRTAPSRPTPTVRPSTPPAPAPPPAPASVDNDLQIFHSAAEELGYGSTARDVAPTPSAPTSFEDPDEPGLDATARIRRLHAGIGFLERSLEAKQEELSAHSIRLQETHTESERLSALTGTEPRDVEKLGSLVESMKNVQARREQLAQDEARLRLELSEREAPIDDIERLDRTFQHLDEADRAFLDEYREADAVRRGTQALLRSESRLDESRIQEIGGTREASARLALLPLCVSIAGIASWISKSVGAWNLLPWPISIGLGLGGALVAGLILWRARSLRHRDQHKLVRSLEGRHERLAEIDHAASDAGERIATLAERLRVEKPVALLDDYEQWKAFLPEVQRLAALRQHAGEIDREIVSIRQRLDSFDFSEEGAASQASTAEFEKLYRDYVLFFELHQQRETQEAQTMQLETDLAEIEEERADLTERLERALARAGVDASRDLDEAVERFALKGIEVEIDPPAKPSRRTPSEPDGYDDAPDVDAPGDTSWIPTISARTEAVVRRFLPEVREVEVDATLRPSCKFDPRGPRLNMEDLEKELSAAALDQLCLALRLAIVETVSSSGERFPVFLDDPLIRADDARYDLALDFLVDDASKRGQVVLLTAQDMRSRCFLHQYPHHLGRIVALTDPGAAAPAAPPADSQQPAPSSPS